MAKIQRVVLPVEEIGNINYPHNNDVLLYDATKKVWYQTTKEDLLKAERIEIKNQAEKIDNFTKEMEAYRLSVDSEITTMKKTISSTLDMLTPIITNKESE